MIKLIIYWHLGHNKAIRNEGKMPIALDPILTPQPQLDPPNVVIYKKILNMVVSNH
jgi:hypothetical protein